MKYLLIIPILMTLYVDPGFADNHYCQEVWAELQAAVNRGHLTQKQAASIYGRCDITLFTDKD